jgi:hypothetical protein
MSKADDERPVGATAETLLRMLYVTYVYGAEAFAYVLESYQGLTLEQRRKFEACRRLEVMVSGLLFDHITRDLGQTLKPPARARQAALALATQRHGTWFDRMAELEAAAIRGVEGARLLTALYGARQAHLCAVCLGHEMALRDFARDEMDGESEHSIDRVMAMLGPADRAAVAAFEA